MPRGKAKFWAGGGSPKHADWDWREQPEETVAAIAADNGARYIPESLIFTPGGRVGEALFETFEDGGPQGSTNFFKLAEQLDAIEFQLFVDKERWSRPDSSS